MPSISVTPSARRSKPALSAGTPSSSPARRTGRSFAGCQPITLTAEERAFLDGPTEELCRKLDDWKHPPRAARHAPTRSGASSRRTAFSACSSPRSTAGLGFSAQAQSLVLGKISSREPRRRHHRHGAELARARRADREIRHRDAEGALPAAARARRGDSLLCAHRPVLRLRRRLDARCRRGDQGLARGQARRSASSSPGTSATSRSRRTRRCSASPSACSIRTTISAAARTSASRSRSSRPIIKASRSAGGIFPCGAAFPNGPTSGKDVFIPIDWIIGGKERAGQGWRMLMECLAAGRSISLPATSAAAAKSLLRTTTAYARIRKQFNLPIGYMEGVEEPLARMVETAYALEAARAVTASMVVGRREAGGDLGAAQISVDRAHAAKRQRRARHSRRARHLRRAVELSARRLSDDAGRHHGRGRQHPHPHADHLRARRAPQPPLPLAEIEAVQNKRPGRGVDGFERALRRPCELHPRQCLRRAVPQSHASGCSPARRRTQAPRGAGGGSSPAPPAPSRWSPTSRWRCSAAASR